MTTNVKEWQWRTTNGPANDKWKQMTKSGTANGNEWKWIRASKGEWFEF